MGNSSSSRNFSSSAQQQFNNEAENNLVVIELEKPESDFQPGDIIRGNIRLTVTSAALAEEIFQRRYEGITITLTGVEYAFSNDDGNDRRWTGSRLVVTDTFKLGRDIDFVRNDNDRRRRVEDQRTTMMLQEHQDGQYQENHRFEIELPAASPEIEIDLNEFQPFGINPDHVDEIHNNNDDRILPDAQTLSSCSCSLSSTSAANLRDDDDDDDDDDWEMLSTKRHSLTRPTMARKQYAYKIKASLRERQRRDQDR